MFLYKKMLDATKIQALILTLVNITKFPKNRGQSSKIKDRALKTNIPKFTVQRPLKQKTSTSLSNMNPKK